MDSRNVPCQRSTRSHTAAGLLDGVGAHGLLVGEGADPEGHAGHGGELRVAVEHAGQGVLEHGAVVAAGTDHDLAVDLDPPGQQRTQPAQAGGTPPVAQQAGPDVGVGGVDRDEQRAQPLGQDPLEVHLGESGQGGEVAVQERQPVVVVLHRQAAPHALGELVDEAELAVVVARADPVEHGRGDLDAERLARPPCGRSPGTGPSTPRRRTRRSSSGSSTRRLYSMTSRGERPLSESSSSPERSPDSAAGDDVGDGDDLRCRRHSGRRHGPKATRSDLGFRLHPCARAAPGRPR